MVALHHGNLAIALSLDDGSSEFIQPADGDITHRIGRIAGQSQEDSVREDAVTEFRILERQLLRTTGGKECTRLCLGCDPSLNVREPDGSPHFSHGASSRVTTIQHHKAVRSPLCYPPNYVAQLI